MSDTSTNRFIGRGTTAERLAFVPDPGTPEPTPKQGYTFFDTDLEAEFAWDGADWVNVTGAAAAITALTGDVTATGPGSAAATIANDAVTYAKMQNVSAAERVLGRGAGGGAGDVQELALGTGLSMSGTTINAAATPPGGSDKQVQYNNAGALGGISNGTAGHVLTSNGAGSAPSMQAPTGTPAGTTGQVQVNAAGVFGAIAEGTAGFVLTSTGAGTAPTMQAPVGGSVTADTDEGLDGDGTPGDPLVAKVDGTSVEFDGSGNISTVTGGTAVAADTGAGLQGNGTSASPLEVKVDGVSVVFNGSGELEAVTGAGTVSVDAAAAMDGDGSVGDPLAVKVDGVTIGFTGGGELEAIAVPSTVVVDTDAGLDGDGSGGDPLVVKVDGSTIQFNPSGELEAIGGGGGGGDAGLVWLGTFDATGLTNIDIPSLITSDYDEYLLKITNLRVSNAGTIPKMRVSIDNGSTFISSANYNYGRWAGALNGAGSSFSVNNTTEWDLFADMPTAGQFSQDFIIKSPLNAASYTYLGAMWGVATYQTGPVDYMIATGGRFTVENAVNAIRVYASGNTFVSGTVVLYGYAKAAGGGGGGGGTVVVDTDEGLDGDGSVGDPLVVKVDGVSVIFNGSGELEAPGGGGGTVDVDGAAGMDGDGSVGDPLAVKVDGVTVIFNGSGELESTGGTSTVTVAAAGALDGDGSIGDPLAVRVDNTTLEISSNNLRSKSQANPSWLTALAFSKLTGVPDFARRDQNNTFTGNNTAVSFAAASTLSIFGSVSLPTTVRSNFAAPPAPVDGDWWREVEDLGGGSFKMKEMFKYGGTIYEFSSVTY